jgi:hypothetical protein
LAGQRNVVDTLLAQELDEDVAAGGFAGRDLLRREIAELDVVRRRGDVV